MYDKNDLYGKVKEIREKIGENFDGKTFKDFTPDSWNDDVFNELTFKNLKEELRKRELLKKLRLNLPDPHNLHNLQNILKKEAPVASIPNSAKVLIVASAACGIASIVTGAIASSVELRNDESMADWQEVIVSVARETVTVIKSAQENDYDHVRKVDLEWNVNGETRSKTIVDNEYRYELGHETKALCNVLNNPTELKDYVELSKTGGLSLAAGILGAAAIGTFLIAVSQSKKN